MNRIAALLLIGAIHATAQSGTFDNIVRQSQQDTGVVWDMPLTSTTGTSLSAMALGDGSTLFQLWAIDKSTGVNYLLDHKLIGAYLPTADIRITTLDPYTKHVRTRVDKPFTVTITIGGLQSGAGLPLAATKVLLERHLGNHTADMAPLDPAVVTANTPYSSAYLTSNGNTVLNFPVTALTASIPTQASGEEYFVVQALADGTIAQSQIASENVQVWPMTTGSIKGIATGDNLRFQMPQIQLLLNNLYPSSDTYLLLYPGTQTTGAEGVVVTSFPMDRDTSESHVVTVSGLDAILGKDGTYTLALVTDTVFDRYPLDSVTFSVNRTVHVNSMVTDFTDDSSH